MELNPSYLKPRSLLGLLLLMHETGKWMRKRWYFIVERREEQKKKRFEEGRNENYMLFNMACVEDLYSYEVKNEVGHLEL